MNATEAVLLLRKVKAYRPAQQVDEYTAEAWAESLDDIRYLDANLAVTNIAKRSSDWIDVAMIRNEVRVIRTKRIEAGEGSLVPPSGLTGDQYWQWLTEMRRNLGDGETLTPEPVGELTTRSIPVLTRKVDAA